MSGFETGVSVMPLVRGAPGEGQPPQARIRGTRKLLVAAALIMSLLLLGSSVVTTILIPKEAFAPGGSASGRALAYLAHCLPGHGLGTVYDVSTIAILWFKRFETQLRARVYREEGHVVLSVAGAVAIANSIAWISEQIDPIAIYIQLSLEHPFRANLKYILWGEGETGLMVREVLLRYWHFTPEDDVRPLIFLVSE